MRRRLQAARALRPVRGAAAAAFSDRCRSISSLPELAYFLTGATGFIGRHLVLRLLANRDGDLYVLVRKGSLGRLEELRERYWPARVAELALRGAAEQAPASALGIAGAHAGRLAAELTARIHPVAADRGAGSPHQRLHPPGRALRHERLRAR